MLIYDINTFCNVLNGHEYTYMEKVGPNFSRGGAAQYNEARVPALNKPKEIIENYTSANDKLSWDLKNYKYASNICRELHLNDYKFRAIGLGV